jgi:dienelactone hydrolase
MKLKLFAALIGAALLIAQAAHAEIKTESVDYKQGDTALRGFLAYDTDAKGKRPGVLIMHQYFGLTPFEKGVAERLAKMGYVAFAADIYGVNVRPKSPAEAGAATEPFVKDRTLWRARGEAALQALRRNPHVDPDRIGMIGYCFGGGSALELDRAGAPIVATVVFHGILATPNPADAKNIKGHILALQGGDDPIVTQKDVGAFENEMRNAHVDWEMVQYANARHAYTFPGAGNNPKSPVAYNAEADHRSWIAMTDFFNEYLKH